jgi:hypothetical protein
VLRSTNADDEAGEPSTENNVVDPNRISTGDAR